MTDVPGDDGAPGTTPDSSGDPVVRRSNFTPAPLDAEPPTFDDDLLADAMAAEVSTYTSPIRLPWMPPPAAAEASVPAPLAPASPAPPAVPAAAAASASELATRPSSESEAELLPEDAPNGELLRALGTTSTLEAIELLETELRRVLAGEPPSLNLPTLTEPKAAPGYATHEPAPSDPAVAEHVPVTPLFEPSLREDLAAELPESNPPTDPETGTPDAARDAPQALAWLFPAELSSSSPAPTPVESPGAPKPDAGSMFSLDPPEALTEPPAAQELPAAQSVEPFHDSSPLPAPSDAPIPESSAYSLDPPEAENDPRDDGSWDLSDDPTTPSPANGAGPFVVSGDAGPQFSVPVPFSTEPPTEPEAPDWLAAPPPSYSPPQLVEPPAFLDAPNPALDPVAPITANTMARLRVPLPTEQPKLEDRAELPPPPGYENIPIFSADAAEQSTLAAPIFFPPAGASPPPVTSDTVQSPIRDVIAGPPVDDTDDDDDVIDASDRVSGTTAPPIAASPAPLGAPPEAMVSEPEVVHPPSEPIATVRLGEDEPALVDQKAQSPAAFDVESAGPEPTALDLRAGRSARLFWLWFAANASVVSIGLGAILLGTGMSLRQTIVAILAGVALSFLPLGLGTLAGKWSGQPTMIVSRAAFGHAGNILPALLAILTRVLWGGVLLWVLATAVAQVLVGAGLDVGLGAEIWQLVTLVLGFVIVTLIAVFGYGLVAKVQLVLSVVSALLIVGTGVLTFSRLDLPIALTVPDGSWILAISGAVLVFSVVGLAWVHSSSDLARYQRPGSSGGASMLWATFGATLPPFLLIGWGALLAASDAKLAIALRSNPLAAIASLLPAWYPAPLLAATALGVLSGAVLTIYSGGFALQALGVRARRSASTLIAAALVLAAAAALLFLVADFSSIVRDLIVAVAVPVAAWAGIFGAEMMIRTRSFHAPSLLVPGGVYPSVRWPNFLGLIVVSAIGFGFVRSTVPGLEWLGFLFGPLGFGPDDAFSGSDIGVFIALLLGILLPIVGGIPAIRRQERAAFASGMAVAIAETPAPASAPAPAPAEPTAEVPPG